MHNNIKYKDIAPRWQKPHVKFKQKLVRGIINLFAWTGIAIIYYVAFSFFFDTPLEYRMKRSTEQLQEEYDALSARYDTVNLILDNITERDKEIFKTLFESEPYNFDSELSNNRWEEHEALLSKTNKELAEIFFARLGELEKNVSQEGSTLLGLEHTADSIKTRLNYIPSIQPVINPDLTLLTASYGMRIHPFYKTLVSHQGVDYTVSEGSRVFATADGTVKETVTKNSASGNTIVIDHGNGYETSYSHLDKILAKKGQKVSRGDIIAHSGNSGLSLAPHLHYEIRHNQLRVDPIHFFFMELDHNQYKKITRIAQTGMQSFD